MAYSQAMGWLRCRLSFALLRSSILCLRGARARVKQNFRPSASCGPGRRRHGVDIFDSELTKTSLLATLFYIQTCTHLWTLSRTFLGVCTHPYTGARVSSTYARTHVPTPFDSSANLLLLLMSISSCCYFSVFSSVCIKIYLLDSHM